MARVPLPTRETLPTDELKQRWDRTAERGPVLNVTRAFMLNPDVPLNAFQVWAASGLDPRTREILILRAAFVKKSTYEWHQHVRIGRGVGLSDAEITAIGKWRDSNLFSPEERAILAYVDALAEGRPGDEAFNALAGTKSAKDLFGITFLITLYFQLAQIMAAFDLETEDPFVGWEVG
jgi:alkylhydroperoxidase family enzyme